MRTPTLAQLTLGIGCCLWGSSACASDDPKVSLIREANRNSFQSIRTLYAKYTIVQTPHGGKGGGGLASTTHTEVWQDGDKVRWVSDIEYPPDLTSPAPGNKKGKQEKQSKKLRQEGLLSGSELQIQTKRPNREGKWVVSGTMKVQAQDELLGRDVWSHALFIIRTQPRASLADLLGEKTDVQRLPSEVVDKHPCDRLLVKPADDPFSYQYDVLVDSRYNYLVRRLRPTSTRQGIVLRFEWNVNRFQECAPGLYFPAEVESRGYALKPGPKEELRLVSRVTFTSVVVNRRIDPSVFTFQFTPGAWLWDQRNQVGYKVGKDQKPDGPVVAQLVGGTKDSEPTYDEPPSSRFGYWSLGIAVASLGGLAVGAWWLFRRRRGGAAHAD